jgi:hypothetical protein
MRNQGTVGPGDGTPLEVDALRLPGGAATPPPADGRPLRSTEAVPGDLRPFAPDLPLDLSLGEPPPLFRRPPVAAPAPRWVAPLFCLFAVILVPWIIYLAEALPARQTSEHWDVAWVGFDVMIFLGLASTAYFAARRITWVKESATALAVLLVVDAWFDCLTARPGWPLAQSLTEAFLVELPLAALSIWIARNAEAMTERAARWLRWRAERQALRLRMGDPVGPAAPGRGQDGPGPASAPSAGDTVAS